MERNIRNYAAVLMHKPNTYAIIKGSEKYPNIIGIVRFYQLRNGVLVAAEINGLPYSDSICKNQIYGFHIHSGNKCDGDMTDPFSGAMAHYNPAKCNHPFHAGDLPPLFGSRGYAFSVFLSDRFSLSEVLGKTVIIHGNPDDFTTQPSGNAGEKIACGVIKSCNLQC